MALQHGVSREVVDAIARGDEPPLLDDERVVHAVAQQLVEDGHVDAVTYDAARELLGDRGVVELVTLCGYYTLVSFALNAFDVALPPGEAPTWPGGGGTNPWGSSAPVRHVRHQKGCPAGSIRTVQRSSPGW